MEDKEIIECAEKIKNYCASKDNSCRFCSFYDRRRDCILGDIPQNWNFNISHEMTSEEAVLQLTTILQDVNNNENMIKALELAIKTLKEVG